MGTQQNHLGPYRLQQRLASDATGEYWKAHDTQNQRDSAIAIYHVSHQQAPTVIPLVQQEARILVALQHPGIMPIRNVYTMAAPNSAGSDVAIVTDFHEGLTLADYIQMTAHTGNIPLPGTIVQLLAPIAAAIDYSHQRGIIHGAIRPTNILLIKRPDSSGGSGETKLIGFGANHIQNPQMLSLHDVAYISPEQAQGYTENARSDLYSLGVILYEMCTGALPFQGETQTDIIVQHIQHSPTSPALINPRLLPSLTAVILRGLAKDPTARFPNASAMMVAFARALHAPAPDILGLSGGNLLGISPLPGVSGPMRAISAKQPSVSPASTPILGNPSGALQQSPPSVIAPASTSLMSTPSSPIPTIIPQGYARSAPPSVQPTGNSYTSHPQVMAPPVPPPTPRKNKLYPWLVIPLVILVILGGVVTGAYFLLFGRNATTSPSQTIIGHAFFISSGQLVLNGTGGVADGLQIDLTGLPVPQANKSYYLWLLSDNNSQSNALPIMLGSTSNGGRFDLAFPGDSRHDDLLANYSRFLITEEAAGTPPANPSINTSDWRYYAEFSQKPNPTDTQNHYSLLDHLRHLLAQDPKLQLVNLPGGLDIWLFKNTLKVLEWAGSARDAQSSGDTGLIQRQLVRILDYLDGSQYVQTENIPPDLQGPLADPAIVPIARVALLEFDVQNQNPPGYLKHIGNHLLEIAQTPGVTANQKALAIQIDTAINNVQAWLSQAHTDAEKLIHMTPQQLGQSDARNLLDDLFTQANNAFVGKTDPHTNQVKEGVIQIHYNIQRLATFDIQPYQATP